MNLQTEQQALFLACEMERAAVALYTRALQVMEQIGRADDAVCAMLARILEDEQGHLCRFQSLYQGMDEADEQQLSLSAIAQGILYEGGLMGAARQGLMADTDSLLRLAVEAERTSAQKYRDFAALAQSEAARDALLLIAQEEEGHLADLCHMS